VSPMSLVAVAAGPDADVTVASLQAGLAEALEANARWERTAGELREALAERDRALAEQSAVIAGQAADLEQMGAALAGFPWRRVLLSGVRGGVHRDAGQRSRHGGTGLEGRRHAAGAGAGTRGHASARGL
jgi:hypothetical protein